MQIEILHKIQRGVQKINTEYKVPGVHGLAL